MLIAQLSDCHVRERGRYALGEFDTLVMLQMAVDHINSLRPSPDVVIVSGDIAYEGKPSEYLAASAQLNRLETPWLPVPGNHDDRANMSRYLEFSRGLPTPSSPPFLSFVAEDFPVRLVALDSTRPGASGGELCQFRLSWLAERLAEAPDRPTAIFMHHPPFVTGVSEMDEPGFKGAESLAKIVAGNPQVDRMFCGHLHRPIQTVWSGVLAMTAPAISFQVGLELESGRTAHAIAEPPAIMLHLFDTEGSVVSHMSYIGEYGEPIPFIDVESGLAY